MMVGGGSLGHDEMNLDNPYGGQQIAFLKGSKGSIFNEAFENAYHDPKCSGFANEIRKAHVASFISYFSGVKLMCLRALIVSRTS